MDTRKTPTPKSSPIIVPKIPRGDAKGGGAEPHYSFAPPLNSTPSIVLTLFSSIQHEVLHGHPFQKQRWNEALVAPSMFLTVPYIRFRDTHLAHHRDVNLTDPYDDPVSNYLDPAVWCKLPRAWQILLHFNNTLPGRIPCGGGPDVVP